MHQNRRRESSTSNMNRIRMDEGRRNTFMAKIVRFTINNLSEEQLQKVHRVGHHRVTLTIRIRGEIV